jgi:hypothetical protein
VFSLADIRDCIFGAHYNDMDHNKDMIHSTNGINNNVVNVSNVMSIGSVGDDLLESILLVTLERAQSRGLLTHDIISSHDTHGRTLMHYVSGLGYVHMMLVRLPHSYPN